MTPLAVEMLLWFHTRATAAGPFRGITSEPQTEIVRQFILAGVFQRENEGPNLYSTTDKGKAWVEMILATPMPIPVQVWRDPRVHGQSSVREHL